MAYYSQSLINDNFLDGPGFKSDGVANGVREDVPPAV